MQSRNGGYGAFDVDNTHHYLNQIPFADHGALLDPPTADVTGRCLMFLANTLNQHPEYQPVITRCLTYLRAQQETNGAWYGRWGTNYIYGTWSVLTGFASAGIANDDPCIRKAIVWLKAKQLSDGGWGESNDSYHHAPNAAKQDNSSAFHTALALLTLLTVGETHCLAVETGVNYLLKNQHSDGFWADEYFNAPGFPKFFYLKYHGYHKFFPLWALGRYRSQRFASRYSHNVR
jgi:squalene-hopene/tetraprenyl-beta-curcumene cyclase